MKTPLFYSVFHCDKEIKMFVVIVDADFTFNMAKLFADDKARNGYPCIIKKFTSSDTLIGVRVYNAVHKLE